jgi:hypothetical protein
LVLLGQAKTNNGQNILLSVYSATQKGYLMAHSLRHILCHAF